MLTVVVAVGWALTVAAFLRHLSSQTRAHARREDLLLNQLLHATGMPWQPAPADDTGRAARDAERVARRRRFTARPEQFPAPPDDE